MKLSEIGEYELLLQNILPLLEQSNDNQYNDCTSLNLPNGEKLLWTIDPTPTTVASMVGYTDPYITGWYTGLISLSDIAADGGNPVGMLVSVEIDEDEEVSFYDRFNQGLLDICKKYNAKLMGGNLKTSSVFKATGTAIGMTAKQLPRMGIEASDSIYVIGKTGYFWAAVLESLKGKELSEELKNALCFPEPKVREGQLLSSLNFRVNCMDSSDGILACVKQLARINKKDIVISEDENIWNLDNRIKRIYLEEHIDINCACYSWGEWQLVCSVGKENIEEFEQKLQDNEIVFYTIGHVCEGHGEVFSDSSKLKLNENVLSERFRGDKEKFSSVEIMVNNFLRQEIFI